MATMDVKSFFHSWCAKKGISPTFDIRATGPRHRQRFLCEVRCDGISYVGAGNSTTKKEAQVNAARDFVNFLVRTGQVNQNEVPEEVRVKPEAGGDDGPMPFNNQGPPGPQQMRPVFQDGMGPQMMGPAYQAYGGNDDGNDDGGRRHFTYMDRLQQQKNVEEAEDLDVNAGLHGNWTMENAKSKLHQFMQMNKINADYVYKAVGPDHTRSFCCEMTIYVRQLGRNVTGRETASNKQTASKSCALSLVRQLYHLGVIEAFSGTQLYHLGVIEAFSGTLKKDRSSEGIMKPFPVAISPELEQQLEDCLQELNITPVDVNTARPVQEEGQPASVTLLQVDRVRAMREAKQTPGGVVSWSPPQPNWNAWTACNIGKILLPLEGQPE
ncbi:double-stranded RNA binding motif domain-containing protein [Phthorimaea operculella]|nr:double-stranded RNA binding motif domain-containing protein [Phthorimaea operculella]